ncbi:hypothetical protein ACFFKU_02890 [Kineococcus gynurae]|uniref:Uncharacterized protein n=1 Tax=Kineococcus gynurae TaxID=452979 RepID=A0ABV5LS83_9ACTN
MPLSVPVRSVLERLRYATGMRGAGLARSRNLREPLFAALVHRDEPEVEAWLGFPLPEPAPLRDVGHTRHCLTRDPGPLLPRPGEIDDPPEAIRVYWIPRDVDPAAVHLADPDELSVLPLSIGFQRYPSPREDRPTTRFDSAPGGYTSVTVRGVRYTVQRFADRRTRVAWGRDDLPGDPRFAMEVPLPPVETVEFLVRSPRL